jgi:hypothetical protein
LAGSLFGAGTTRIDDATGRPSAESGSGSRAVAFRCESVVPSKVRGRIDDHRRPVPAATKRRRHDSSVTPAVLQVDDGHVSGVCGWGRTYGLPTIEGAVWGSARVPTVGDSKNRASSSSALELERGKKVTASPRAWRYAIPRDERAPAAPVHSSIWPAA